MIHDSFIYRTPIPIEIPPASSIKAPYNYNVVTALSTSCNFPRSP